MRFSSGAGTTLEEYVLDSADASYEEPGEHVSMLFMDTGGEFYDGNYSHWADQKQPSFTSSTYSDNTNWETVDVCRSVTGEVIRNAAGRVNTSLEC